VSREYGYHFHSLREAAEERYGQDLSGER